MNKIYDKVKECYKQVNEMTEFKPQIALVLGSGLGDYAEKIKIETVIDSSNDHGRTSSLL